MHWVDISGVARLPAEPVRTLGPRFIGFMRFRDDRVIGAMGS